MSPLFRLKFCIKQTNYFIPRYNNERFPNALYGSNASEILNGGEIDKYRFKKEIQNAQKIRYQKNKAGKFCDVCTMN